MILSRSNVLRCSLLAVCITLLPCLVTSCGNGKTLVTGGGHHQPTGLGIATASPLPDQFEGVSYSQIFAASGGTAPYTWSAGGLPNNWAMDSVTGEVTANGSNVSAGSYSFDVTVTDSALPPAATTATFGLTVVPQPPQPLALTTTSPLPAVDAGAPYTKTFVATGGTQPYDWSGANLPTNWTFDAATGVLTAAPGDVIAGVYNFDITVTDSAATPDSDTVSFNLTVNSTTLALSIYPGGFMPSGIEGQAYTANILAWGGTPPYTWTATTALPTNWTLDPATGDIDAADVDVVEGDYQFDVTVTDSATSPQGSASDTYYIHIEPTLGFPGGGLTPIALADGLVNSAYSQNISAQGGTGSFVRWELLSTPDNIPDGLVLSTSGTGTTTAVLSGTPAVGSEGSYSFDLRVTDSSNTTATQTYTIDITLEPLLISTTTLVDAYTGAAYTATITASGGSYLQYNWSITAGALPTGITGLSGTPVEFTPTVTISGTPTAGAGDYDFTVLVEDSDGNTDTADLRITIPYSASWSAISTTNAPNTNMEQTVIWTGTEMIVWGGLASGSISNRGAVYDPAGDMWTTIPTTNAPNARYGHQSVWTGTQMVVWGGTNGLSWFNNGGVYDRASNAWLTTKSNLISSADPTAAPGAPTGREGHCAVWDDADDWLIVWGGNLGNQTAVYNDGGVYNLATDAWLTRPGIGSGTFVPVGRVEASVLWTGSAMFMFGGWDPMSGTSFTGANGGSYDPITDMWSTVADLPDPSGASMNAERRTQFSMNLDAAGQRIFVWGGTRGTLPHHFYNNGWVYDITGNSWTAMGDTGAPETRCDHGAAWTGTELMIYGGGRSAAGVSAIANGGVYDPVAQSWTATASGGNPTGGNHAFWTGTQLLVWNKTAAASALYTPP